ncbi:hypothetical protein [Plebeiibacterium sediminum]|uniref:Lipoprotein n=1 Tax=Plebeiibacterium sediminum TaxID=2992112 RepID=A0AAE3SH72_9BACT|nr:hypothetical protein [Plebeiobacterium sediminum]MCW3788882.1 hypothetical protein [Plebeiobacterium sediminum]
MGRIILGLFLIMFLSCTKEDDKFPDPYGTRFYINNIPELIIEPYLTYEEIQMEIDGIHGMIRYVDTWYNFRWPKEGGSSSNNEVLFINYPDMSESIGYHYAIKENYYYIMVSSSENFKYFNQVIEYYLNYLDEYPLVKSNDSSIYYNDMYFSEYYSHCNDTEPVCCFFLNCHVFEGDEDYVSFNGNKFKFLIRVILN